MWLWTAPAARAAIATRNLAVILRTYRAATGQSQRALAEALGYDPTYVSMIETGRRDITDVGTLRRFARHLGLPPHSLGVTDAEAADFAAMLQFGESTIRLAGLARESGHAASAVNELWPLIARLEARTADGDADRDVLLLLGRARAMLGVALGDVLPEERLNSAAQWTGRALRIAERLDDPELLSHTLRVHGNELRKVGRKAAAALRLQHAAYLAPDGERGAALIQLARVAGDLGDRELFDSVLPDLLRFVDEAPPTLMVNPFAAREVHLRGLVSTGRAALAAQLLQRPSIGPGIAAPTWRAIERVTAAEVFRAQRDTDGAEAALREAITTAVTYRLPHQIQRAIRAAKDTLPTITELGETALADLRLSFPAKT
ncbi:helix-turn-helix transcriptional regulator [Longispora sp. NPDC051575]|uniref:helix-turn-helix transcriptional regulator n=1 Tax=Longispora sp. NPDC051575 TaxID=3154943 RepID=UPI00341A495D